MGILSPQAKMSRFKTKATLDGKVKITEVVRAGLTLPSLQQQLASAFGVEGVSIQYKSSSGLKGVYQQFHLDDAVKDFDATGARYFEVQLQATGAPAPTPSPVASPAKPAPSPTPAAAPKPSTPVASPAKPAPSPAPTPSLAPQPTREPLSPGLDAEASPAKSGAFNRLVDKLGPEDTRRAGGDYDVTPSPQKPKPQVHLPPLHTQGCAGCGNEFTAKIITAMNHDWHPECFVCQLCRKNLANAGFKPVDGRPWCRSCHDDRYAMKCAGCNKTILMDYVSRGGLNFHKHCS